MNHSNDYPYYRQTWNRIVVTLLAAAFVPLVAIGGGVYIFAMRHVTGSKATHVIALLVFFAAGLLIVGAVLLITNDLVSRLENKRRSLKAMDRQLRRTSYLSGSMELSLSYFEEIKQTLINIDSSTAVLLDNQETRASENLLEQIGQIRSQVHRGRNSVDRFLHFIKEEPPLIRDLDIRDVLDHLLEIIQRELHCRDIRVRRNFQQDLPTVRSDRSKLRQVFQNIVLNAVGAIKQGGEIGLHAACRGDSVEVVISDTGPGIAPVDMPKIFEPLWTTKPQGTGLGLSICREILDRLGADITIQSMVGQGTRVAVRIPVQFKPRTNAKMDTDARF